jgi:hypothetical protein
MKFIIAAVISTRLCDMSTAVWVQQKHLKSKVNVLWFHPYIINDRLNYRQFLCGICLLNSRVGSS